MSDTPRVDEKIIELVSKSQSGLRDRLQMTILARTLERELNAANKIIADAKAYIEDVGDDFPEDGLLAILERKVTHDSPGISPVVLPKP